MSATTGHASVWTGSTGGDQDGHHPADGSGRTEAAEGPAGAREAAPVDALHAHGRIRGGRRAGHRARRGLLRLGRPGQPLPRRAFGSVLRKRRPRARRDRRRDGAPGGRARLLHELELRAPARDRAGRADRAPRARRPEPRVLHLGRLGGRRVRAQVGAQLPPHARRRPAAQGDRARDRLPRHLARRALGHRHPGAAHAVRAARAGRLPRAEHERVPLARGARPALGGRQDRGADPVRGPRDGGGRDPRAGAERRRLLHAAGGLLPARPRDLRPPRRAAHLGRGHLLLGPARPLVRLPALRLHARRDHDREGPHLRVRARWAR